MTDSALLETLLSRLQETQTSIYLRPHGLGFAVYLNGDPDSEMLGETFDEVATKLLAVLA